MKTLISSFMLIAFSVLGYLPKTMAACTFQSDSGIANQLTATLPYGIWETDFTQEGQTALHFYCSGELDWFTFSSSEVASLESFQWEIKDHQNGPVLHLSNKEKTLSFDLSGDCYFLQLDGHEEERTVELNHKAAIPKKNQHAKLAQLQGNWENTLDPIAVETAETKDALSAYLKYHFMPDGRFEKRLSNAKHSIKKTGEWKLAKDGKHIIMRMEDGGISVAMLKYLNMDELVLSHVYEVTPMAIGAKDFFFNRN